MSQLKKFWLYNKIHNYSKKKQTKKIKKMILIKIKDIKEFCTNINKFKMKKIAQQYLLSLISHNILKNMKILILVM